MKLDSRFSGLAFPAAPRAGIDLEQKPLFYSLLKGIIAVPSPEI